MSLSAYGADYVLNYLLAGTRYVQLHTGAPGTAGTANVAATSTRQPVTFGAASGQTASNTGVPRWSSIATAETYNHISIWSAASGGNCLATQGMAAAKTVGIGDSFEFPAASIVVTAA